MERPTVKSGSFYVAGKKFVPYGYFYMHDERSRSTLQDYFRSPTEAEKNIILDNFRELREMYNANTVRLFLDMPIFLQRRGVLRKSAVDAALALIRGGREMGLYFALTGLTHTEIADRMPWYDALPREERWDVQARFWYLLAKTLRSEANIAWYEVTNEPTIGNRYQDGWYHGLFGGFSFAQHVAITRKESQRQPLARSWLIRMRKAIKSADNKALVGAGLLPWTNPGNAFNPKNIRGTLDVYPVHIYPGENDFDWSVWAFKEWDRLVSGPVVVGEIFTLNGSPELIANFLTQIQPNTAGYVSFYSGEPVGSDYDYPNKAVAESNLEMFSGMCSVLCSK